jgi:hypothetical protein
MWLSRLLLQRVAARYRLPFLDHQVQMTPGSYISHLE